MGKRAHPDTIPLESLPPDVLAALGEDLPKKSRHVQRPKLQPVKSKKNQRKDQARRDKQAKNLRRQELLDQIKANSIKNPQLSELLAQSGRLGQKDSKRQSLKRAKLAEDVGLKVDYEPLFREVKVIEEDFAEDAHETPVFVSRPAPAVISLAWPKADFLGESSDVSESAASEEGEASAPEFSFWPKSRRQVSRLASVEAGRRELPILNMEQELVEAVAEHTFVIVAGETGSGKSTQLPQMLLEAGFCEYGRIGVRPIQITQPRKVAAIALATRVSEELGVTLGQEVGYQVRYDAEFVSEGTLIKFMTDGILMREVESDFLLKGYSVIVVDEAHERTVNTDILIGLLSRIASLRWEEYVAGRLKAPLKIVIMSATLRTSEFAENPRLFKETPPIVKIEARQFEVTLHHSKYSDKDDCFRKCLQKVVKLHSDLPEGNVLVFLTGKKEVLQMQAALKRELPVDETKVLPLFSMLSQKRQMKVFAPPEGKRMIVISTNVAETSLTLPGIKYVIDSGLEKRKVYEGRLQVSKHVVTWISKASAQQRSGRAGRTGPGHCYRLYSNAAYGHFEDFRPPEITSVPISLSVLRLKALGIKDAKTFPFPTAPSDESIREGLRFLMEIGALQTSQRPDFTEVTELGRYMSALPVHPRYSKLLILGIHFKLEKLTVLAAAALSVEQIFLDLSDHAEKTKRTAVFKKTHGHWQSRKSDITGLVKVLKASVKHALTGEPISAFADEHALNSKGITEALDLAQQLYGILQKMQGKKAPKSLECFRKSRSLKKHEDQLLELVVTVFKDQIAQRGEAVEGGPVVYTAESGKQLCIHPSSFLFRKAPPEFISYIELIDTKRTYARTVTEVPRSLAAQLNFI
jgi:HrpA-like RNA helicase